MPRPATKNQLIDLAEKEYQTLISQIKTLPPEEHQLESTPENWSAADFLAHLWEWQAMFFDWYEAGCRGENPPLPAQDYKWSQLPALNLMIYKKHLGRPLKDLLAEIETSHRRLLDLISSLPEEDLFTPGRYPWLRTNTLAAYMTSIGSSHYLWACKEIRKIAKSA
jgi:hypothetical protein